MNDKPSMAKLKFHALYSGGKDSTVTASVLEEAGLLDGVIAMDTGISDPDWMPFILRSCEKKGWNLKVYKTNENYDNLVLKYGFPGPGLHGLFMNYLKGRCIRQYKKDNPNGVLASGVRTKESKRRKFNTKMWSVMEGVPIFAPIYHWSDDEVWAYFTEHGFEKAPAYEKLCISGDCLCGAFASPEEPYLLKTYYPEVYARLKSLEEKVGDTWGRRSIKGRKRKKKSHPLCLDCDNMGEVDDEQSR